MNKKQKTLREFMKLPYTVVLKRDSDGDIIARVKELEGCVADGQDELEALGNLEVVKELWFATALDAGQSLPLPEVETDLPSGKFLMRVPRTLHKDLISLATFEGVSLNHLVVSALAEMIGRRGAGLLSVSAVEDYQAVPSLARLQLVHSKSGKKVLDNIDSTEWTDSLTLSGSSSYPAKRVAGAY